MNLHCKRLAPDAQLPRYAKPGDAGLDLFSRELRTLNPFEPTLFSLGIALALPEGTVGIVADRSGLARRGVTTLGGVIDCTYRGELGVVLVNVSESPYTVHPGDRIAQLLVTPIVTATVEECEELGDSVRGADGFGSTGR
jgi:dUTP pyrophosphatase